MDLLLGCGGDAESASRKSQGRNKDGSADGMMMHNLANKRCMQFGRCNSEGNALLNEELITLLYAGRGETEANNCQALKKGSSEIESLLQVGLIQSTLRYALKHEKSVTQGGDLAAGYVFSRAVLPYIEEVDGEAAQVIKKNMDFRYSSRPLPDGAMAVFVAFSQSIPKIGLDCERVGVTGGKNVCDIHTLESSANRHPGLHFSILTILLSFSFMDILNN